MGREIHPHKFALFLEPLGRDSVGGGGDGRTPGCRHLGIVAEERHGRRHTVVLESLSVAHHRFGEGLASGILVEEILTFHILEAVQGSGIDEVFERAAVDASRGHSFYEIVDAFKRAVGGAFVYDGFDHALAHTLDGRESEAYVAVGVHTEFHERLVDVGAEYLDLHAFALVHESGELGDVRAVAREDGRHVFGRIVGLQPGCLVGHP